MKPEDLVEFQKLVDYLGTTHVLRVEKWKGQQAWRVGLDWFSGDEYEFICEQKELLDALRLAYKYTQGTLTAADNKY